MPYSLIHTVLNVDTRHNLINRLRKAAFISSPLFAIYAVAHPLIFNMVKPSMLISPLAGLFINISVVWGINIFIVLKYGHEKIWKRVLYSYTLNFFFQSIFAFIGFNLRYGNPLPFISYVFLHPIITSIVINIIVIIICDNIYTLDTLTKSKLKSQELEVKNAEAQKKLLIQQLQPHFLFNALSVLKSLIKENTDDAEAYTVRLADFLRYALHSEKTEVVPLKNELEFVEDYVNLQKLRFGSSFQYDLSIPDEAYTASVPVFAVQTLIENAFKHNMHTERNPLKIKVWVEKAKLCIENSKNISPNASSIGTGLSNLNARYELICGQTISINDGKDYFEVKIPLIY
jgi:two-component system, LytTR family, sensor kinase